MSTPRFRLERNSLKRLVLIDEDGFRFEDVEPIRAFPLSDPKHAISICDERGREVVYVESLDDLDAQTRAVVEEELAKREFVPVIQRILNMPGESEPSTWQVETDRGVTTFEVESEDFIHRRDPHQMSIVDTKGIRYLVPDTRKLDAHSRRVLDRFL